MLTLPEFVGRWQASTRSERSGSQEHFLNLCEVLGQPTPASADQSGAFYTFEKGVSKTGGGQGFADVWLRGQFAWEYKGKRKNLTDAYAQLLTYREDLENPPLLVVCDLNRFEVHTNFTGTAKRVYAFTLADLLHHEPTPTCALPPLDVLRAVFSDASRLRPQETTAQVTERAAGEFAKLAESLRSRGADPEEAAHFLMRLLFCLFAEDIGLLPGRLFTRLVQQTRSRPEEFTSRVRQLFAAMVTGGSFGVEDIAHFNGGLFAGDAALTLTRNDLAVLAEATALDWSSIEPAIFGTLFERSLDPGKRAQLGAHYTSREDILLIVEPVLMAPLRRRWEAVQTEAAALIARRPVASGGLLTPAQRGERTRLDAALTRLLIGFSSEIASVRVLDPACGSSNFLYVALKRLLDLEKEVFTFAATNGLSGLQTQVDPGQLHGIEINPYAHELAQVVVWIGYIQWLNDNGFGVPSSPILKPLNTIQRMDAVLSFNEVGRPVEPGWPAADVIIGNPPFLGGKRLRTALGDSYVNHLFALYNNRVPREADLVTYWFERARALIEQGDLKRAGLLATQSIRRGANQRVLAHIKQTGDIFLAWPDRAWVLDGAAVRVSMIGFDNGIDNQREVDGSPVVTINADLSATLDLTSASRLVENSGICFQGPVKIGAFEISAELAERMLKSPNPNGKPSSDVVRPWVNASDITGRPRGMFIIDFNIMTGDEAALYEMPFEHILRTVKPEREKNRRAHRKQFWWHHGETVPSLRRATDNLRRVVCTPRVAKHRVFDWVPARTLPDSRLLTSA